MNAWTFKVAGLLLGSGACALVYQVAWLRTFRQIFGSSTAASAAVLAIFMGGLGAGGLFFGRRADRHPRPLAMYARLEFLIAISAAATPLLVLAVRQLYLLLGGASALGPTGATLARLLLSAIVLSVPTVLMGGTLPAASRAATTDADAGRRRMALLYGANTLGAVCGVLISTFVLLEAFGTRKTLWLACAVNLVVAAVALRMARLSPEAANCAEPDRERPARREARLPAPRFVLAASAIVGFAFLLMELVWYRMLGPILGGSTFTFGLILGVALAGVGLGGLGYTVFLAGRRATVSGFALTCSLEAAWLAIPLALGDRIALLAERVRTLGEAGFHGQVLGWGIVASVVVLPAAIVAGVQFPLLIALLGRGRERIGRHVGLGYAWNTAGAIVGSLAGGFGLLPLLSAPGSWRAVVVLLILLGVTALPLAVSNGERKRTAVAPAVVALLALGLSTAEGPTAAWRHSGIGAGRTGLADASANETRDWLNRERRALVWEAEGVESSVGLSADNGLAFLINGKSDGNAKGDAPTQVMLGLVGAALHPKPERALVIGLGTGSTAGWLAGVDSMQRVDVVELEPAIVEVARRCASVNRDALDNPRVRVLSGDGRELLLTTRERYDLIVSEPSNPYRAGVASLFTREFYQAASDRLDPDGLFVKWLQGYEIDWRTLNTVLSTMLEVFPHVEIWRTKPSDLVLIGSHSPLVHDVQSLRARLAGEPYRSAMANAWRARGLAGFLSRFLASADLVRELAADESERINTDDQPFVEFAFARTLGRRGLFDVRELSRLAAQREASRPALAGGEVRWDLVEDERVASLIVEGIAPELRADLTQGQRSRYAALIRYLDDDPVGVVREWSRQDQFPNDLTALAALAESTAQLGDERAAILGDLLRQTQPIEADFVLARRQWRQGRGPEAARTLAGGFVRLRTDPWPWTRVTARALMLARTLAAGDVELAGLLFEALEQPFAVSVLDEERKRTLLYVGSVQGPGLAAQALAQFEPHILWEADFLRNRLATYRAVGHRLTARAERDLAEFLALETSPAEEVDP